MVHKGRRGGGKKRAKFCSRILWTTPCGKNRQISKIWRKYVINIFFLHFPFRSFTFRSNVLCPWCIIARGWSYKISLFYAIEIRCTWWKIKVSLQVFFSSSLLPNFCDIFKGENCNSTKIEILHISVRNFVEISVLKQKHKNVYSFFTLQ